MKFSKKRMFHPRHIEPIIEGSAQYTYMVLDLLLPGYVPQVSFGVMLEGEGLKLFPRFSSNIFS